LAPVDRFGGGQQPHSWRHFGNPGLTGSEQEQTRSDEHGSQQNKKDECYEPLHFLAGLAHLSELREKNPLSF